MLSNISAAFRSESEKAFDQQGPRPILVGDAANPSADTGSARIEHLPRPDKHKHLTSEKLHLALDVLRVVDVLVFIFAGLLVHSFIGEQVNPLKWSSHFVDTLVACMIAPFLLDRANLYAPALLRSTAASARAAAIGTTSVFAMLIAFRFATGTLDLDAPAWTVTWFAATGLAMVASRIATARLCITMIRNHALHDTIAIVGGGVLADRLYAHASSTSAVPLELIGIFDDRASRLPPGTRPVTGPIDDLLELGKHRRIDRVLITLPWSADNRIIEIANRLKALSVDVALCPDVIMFAMQRRQMELLGDLPILSVGERPLRRWNWVLKRIEDLVLGVSALIMLAPLLCIVAVAIKLDSPGPIFFRQRRHGFNNTEIEVFKFRSMRTDLTDHKGATQASRKDPRITRVGGFLRRSSLDELPQLLNVIRGDMSLVGPRPHPIGMKTQEKLCHEIVDDYAHRHRVKPGITGWAQVTGFRGATTTEDQLIKRVERDLYYIENWSIFFDFKIMFKTIFKVVSAEDAY